MPISIQPALIALLRSAHRVTVLTGAGVSQESGVPTFREAQTGLWAQYNPTDLATPAAFLRNPRLVWEWYVWRRKLVRQARPNPGHVALVDLERFLTTRGQFFTLITQNVDGLHRLAGSQRVVELHGTLWRTKCFQENVIVESWPDTNDVPPHCPHCGALLRPDVVWFDEPLPGVELESATQAAEASTVFLSIGTSGLVQPAASLPHLARQHGAVIVEINPEDTPLTLLAQYVLRGKAGDILPQLTTALGAVPEK